MLQPANIASSHAPGLPRIRCSSAGLRIVAYTQNAPCHLPGLLIIALLLLTYLHPVLCGQLSTATTDPKGDKRMPYLKPWTWLHSCGATQQYCR
jgi:hypothetical protein